MKYPQPQLSITNLGAPRVKFLVRSLVVLGLSSGFTIPAFADITTGGDGTIVSPAPGSQPNTINITGGTQQGTTNLFHSFGTFNLNSNQVANFQPGATTITNILGRVTGGEPSSIDGRIQVIGGDPKGVNLYLMNPAGIVFGKGASLDINGAFTATTAKAIGFGNGNWFNALGTNNYDLLTGNPDGFAFTNTPGSIFSAATFDATNSDLTKRTTKPGQSITLVGGTVISTGDIKTAGGNISIATVEGGKYVQIKADGSILRLDLPASAANINGAKTFTALSLPDLLTNTTGVDLTATGVTVDPKTKVVTLVGDPTAIANAIALGDTVSKQNRSISRGDVVTKNLDTSNSVKGGNIHIDSSIAILTGNINTNGIATDKELENKSGIVVVAAQTEIKTGSISSSTRPDLKPSPDLSPIPAAGGNVTLSTQTGGIIVDYISTSTSLPNGDGRYKSRDEVLGLVGGDLTIKAADLFRLIDASVDTSINTALFGKINIKHGSKSFVTGVEIKFQDNNGTGGIPYYSIVEKPGFTFPDGASGSRKAIVTSRASNGSVIVVYTDKGFQDVTGSGVSIDGFKITGKTDQSNPDEQASRQKSKDNCTPNSTSVAANPTTATTRSSGKAISPSVDPCKSKVGTGKILQVLTDKK
jgi:filamentous hemagglutinin family protein